MKLAAQMGRVNEQVWTVYTGRNPHTATYESVTHHLSDCVTVKVSQVCLLKNKTTISVCSFAMGLFTLCIQYMQTKICQPSWRQHETTCVKIFTAVIFLQLMC